MNVLLKYSNAASSYIVLFEVQCKLTQFVNTVQPPQQCSQLIPGRVIYRYSHNAANILQARQCAYFSVSSRHAYATICQLITETNPMSARRFLCIDYAETMCSGQVNVQQWPCHRYG